MSNSGHFKLFYVLSHQSVDLRLLSLRTSTTCLQLWFCFFYGLRFLVLRNIDTNLLLLFFSIDVSSRRHTSSKKSIEISAIVEGIQLILFLWWFIVIEITMTKIFLKFSLQRPYKVWKEHTWKMYIFEVSGIGRGYYMLIIFFFIFDTFRFYSFPSLPERS